MGIGARCHGTDHVGEFGGRVGETRNKAVIAKLGVTGPRRIGEPGKVACAARGDQHRVFDLEAGGQGIDQQEGAGFSDA